MARFQCFELPDNRASIPERLALLRARFQDLEVGALLLPRSDAYLGEFISPADERLAWATGFTGSAGTLLLLPTRAVLFLDGRYLVQGGQQTDPSHIEIVNVHLAPPEAWIRENLPSATRIAADPWLHSIAFLRRLEQAGTPVRRIESNPVDDLWLDRPPRRHAPVRGLDPDLAGEDSHLKRERLTGLLRKEELAGVLIGSPESVNWLFNIRGSDTPNTPVVQARALLRSNGDATLLIDAQRLDSATRNRLGDGVRLVAPSALRSELAGFGDRRLAMDPHRSPDRLRVLAKSCGAIVTDREDPVVMPRAQKNPAELEGMRHAHRLDGAAMASFLSWLDRRWPLGGLTEIEAAEKLERCRLQTGELQDIAFDTISASGPNAALPHYRVSRASNRTVRQGELLLMDSGGQYRTGTTDITRTIAIGEVSDDARTAYTLVLRAMIRLSSLEFPEYATGIALDAIAREVLWRHGQDYNHGTGHGVGAGLGVHEGPFSLSSRGRNALRPLKPGFVLSNEPGIYMPGNFGVRIENLLICEVPASAKGERSARLSFETLTLAPIDRRPLRLELLQHSDVLWLDDYHANVVATILPLCQPEARDWLRHACRPLSQ